MKIKSDFNFGDLAQDKITGFQGTITGFAAYLTGCYQFLLAPKCKDNKIEGGTWFDEGRLKKVKSETFDTKAQTKGCDISAPNKG